MGFMGIGTGELIVILALAALVVGPEKMVKFARDAGRLLARLRQETEGLRGEFSDALDLDVGDTVDEIKQIGQEAQEIKSEIEGAMDFTGRAKPRAERPTPGARPTAAAPERKPSGESSFVSAEQQSPDAEPVELRGPELVPAEDEAVEPVSLGGVATIEEQPKAEVDTSEGEG